MRRQRNTPLQWHGSDDFYAIHFTDFTDFIASTSHNTAMPRMTPIQVAEDLAGLASLAESLSSESVVDHVSYGRKLEAKAFTHARDLIDRHLVPRWHVPDADGLHWIECLPPSAPPQQVRCIRIVPLDGSWGWDYWAREASPGVWVRLTCRVCRVSDRPVS